MLGRAKHELAKNTRTMIYNSLFRPYMTYGIEHFGATADKHLKKLKTLQKKTIRIVHGLRYKESTSQICKENNILKIEDEIIVSRIQLAKSIAQDDAPANIKLLLETKEKSATRSSDKHTFILPKTRTNMGRKNSPYNIPFLWNNLHSTAQSLEPKALTKFIKKTLTSMYT